MLLVSVWVVAACALGASAIFDRAKPFGFEDPDSESTQATETLEAAAGERVLPDVVLLVEPGGPIGSVAAQQGVDAVARELASAPDVVRVETPESDPRLISADRRAALVIGRLESSVDNIEDVGEALKQQFGETPGLSVGGSAVTAYELTEVTEDDLTRIELYAAPLLFVLSLLVFRGLVAALIPTAVGALSILSTLLLLGFLSAAVDIDVFAINIVTALGLGLAIDYSLFVVSRYREELQLHGPTSRALEETMGAVGPMIAFSGVMVAVALASLVAFPQRFLYSIGIGGALVAVLSAAVVILVLPALLAALGERVNALAPPRLQRREGGQRWYRFARGVMRHPIPVATVTAAVMIAAGIPFLRVELTRADAAVLPKDTTAYQVDRAIRDRFSLDPHSRVVVVIEDPADARTAGVAARRALGMHPAIGEVEPPRAVGDRLVRTDAELAVDPFSDQAVDSVELARELNWGGESLVGGPPAELTDQRESLAAHLPLAVAFIVVSTTLVLFAMTRSVTLPLVALLMNALTVSVAFGALVFIFEDGRLEGVLDFTSQGALDTSMPILLFALAFGLSTDYGVFLLQRISEARAAGADDYEAVALGLERSGRIITAAALLFAVAMGAFIFSELIYVKQFALGTAIAVLVDATLVRALLFPSLLRLLGPWAWWAPGRLRRPEARPQER